jgi:pyridoxal/pyridoxine/pyridoxamine kinase
MAHKGHPICPHTSKAACEQARREELGKCTEMTADQKNPTQCARWANSLVNGRGLCDMHAGTILARELAERQDRERMEAVNARIDQYIEWTKTHPHVWDTMKETV